MQTLLRRASLAFLPVFALIFGLVSVPQVHADQSPFDNLTGIWTGTGTARFDDGTASRVRCKATYNGRGVQLDMIIYCSSGRHIFEIESKLSYDHGKISGPWRENIRSAGGEAYGRATGSRFSLRISGSVDGAMRVSHSKSRQSVAISTKGLPLTGVKITLSRR